MPTTSPGQRLKAGVRKRIGPLGVEETDIVFRACRDVVPPVMLDVGAHRGSSLLPFAEHGWTVHAFEPDPSNRAVLERVAAGFEHVTVEPYAVADAKGALPLYTSQDSSGISSLEPFHESHTPSGEVPVITLREYATKRNLTEVGFLKIDVEGYEREVLAGFDWSLRPPAIVAEFEDAKTVPRGYEWRDLADLFAGKGYKILVSEWHPIEAYGTEHKWRRFAEYPTDLVDDRGWGNLIAVDPDLWPRLQGPLRAARLKTALAFVRRVGRNESNT